MFDFSRSTEDMVRFLSFVPRSPSSSSDLEVQGSNTHILKCARASLDHAPPPRHGRLLPHQGGLEGGGPLMGTR